MPDSLRWAGVIGVGAPVSGSRPEAVLGKAITSRMLLAPASSMSSRSQPDAIPPWGRGGGEEEGGRAPAEREPPVWRRAVLEGVKQEAELRPRLLRLHPDHVEDLLLNGCLVDTQRSTADLGAVEDKVIGVGEGVGRL